MSHTYNAAGGTRFFHDGDFGGDISVIVRAMPRSVPGADGSVLWEVPVPFADLRELVFAYLRWRRIEFAEQAADDVFERNLLGGTAP
jgi:hypothetical protein